MMTFSGTVKNGGVYDVGGKDGSRKQLISFTVVDEVGNSFACQMWPDDPQHAQLAQVIPNARRQPVQFEVAGYTVRMRSFKDGRPDAPQANFIVTNVQFPRYGQASASYGQPSVAGVNQ
jgi:hypothetical protein